MDRPIENVCCRKSECVTNLEAFETIVLDVNVLSVAIVSRSDIYADDPEYSCQLQKGNIQAIYNVDAWIFGSGKQTSYSLLRCMGSEKPISRSTWDVFRIPRRLVTSTNAYCLLYMAW